MTKKQKRLEKSGAGSRKMKMGWLFVLVTVLCFLIWVVYANWQGVQHTKRRELTQKSLYNVLTACVDYWGDHPTETCKVPPSKKEQIDWGLNPDKVRIAIVDGREESFKATAKHDEDDAIYQIDGQGNIDTQKTR